MHKLRSLLPGHGSSSAASGTSTSQRQSVSLEPEIGFQITIEASQNNSTTTVDTLGGSTTFNIKSTVPELNVQLIAARHLPSLFGFKIVQGYMIKVKLFPGSKRLDSTIQTNTWPKFNESFRFSLVPEIKPAMKHSSRRSSRTTTTCDFNPEELFAGQFVVFTVYALLELPPASFNRLNKTYRSLRNKSSNLVQKVVDSTTNSKAKDDKENQTNGATNGDNKQANGNKLNPRDPVPPLTISEARRNIGSVTCYLEPKLFKRNARTGQYETDELWLPIKDITSTVPKGVVSNLNNSPKGVVEIALELRDLSANNNETSTEAAPKTPPNTASTPNANSNSPPQWNRMTSEVLRKVKGISPNAALRSSGTSSDLALRITTARMRCSNKVKDELEATAGSVYVKTAVFEYGVLIDSWKSPNFYPSLSTKWDVGVADSASISIPLKNLDCLANMMIRTTLATKTKMGKKIVLGTVYVGSMDGITGSGLDHMQNLLDQPMNEKIAMWHCYQ